jgi:hypothetical protein
MILSRARALVAAADGAIAEIGDEAAGFGDEKSNRPKTHPRILLSFGFAGGQ